MKARRSHTTIALLLFCFGWQQFDAFVTVHPTTTTTKSQTLFSRAATILKAHYYDRPNSNKKRPQQAHNSNNKFKISNNNKSNRGGPRTNHSSRRGELTAERRQWLVQTTKDLLASEPGTLVKGKWHELVSMSQAWARLSKSETQSPPMIEQLLKRLLDERRAGNDEAKADISMYNLLLDSWACAALFRTHDPAVASQRAREILVLLQETFEVERDVSLRPNSESFSVVFHVVCKTEGPFVARRVLAWMEYVSKFRKNILAKPSRKQYIMLLDAYANSNGDNAGLLAEGFIRHMNITGVQPDTLCYNIAIKAWTRSKRGRESAEHADRILDEMEAPKDLVTYSTVIFAWSKSDMRSHAVSRAEELLRNIEDTESMEPNTIVLNTVMSTWVKSRNPAAANRTQELLDHMEASDVCPPDLISYNTHLHALSVHSKRQGYAQRANDLLDSLEARYQAGEISFRPNLFSYNLVIDAWSKSEEYSAAWNAVKLLRKLIDRDQKGPDPDTYSFDQVLTALSRSSRPGAAQLGEQLLQYMVDADRLRMYKYAKPDVMGYTSVIVALARSREPDAAERAEALLQQMKEAYKGGARHLKPTRFVFNSLIDCWAKSGKGTYAARKAEALLQEMEGMCSSGDSAVAPNIVTYNAVLNSWARSGTRCCANKAEEYLERMWDLYNSGDGKVAPNDKSFNTVINAISKSPNEAKAQKALRILRRMDKLYQAGYKDARPNAVTYTSVLNSCAFPASVDQRTKRKAFDTAIFTLHELQASRYGSPNDIAYGTFIQACANLLSKDDKMLRVVLEDVFQQCCKDGQVGEMVLYHLRDAAPEDLYNELLAEVLDYKESIKIDDIPAAWRRNVLTTTRTLPRRVNTKVKTNKKLLP